MAEPEPPTSSGTVDAQEHARVLNNYVVLSDQFAAANEVLSALGRSAGDPDAVLTTVVESARRLCRSDAAHLYVLEDGVYRLIKAVGLSDESVALIAEHPMPLDRETLIGRVGLDRKTQQIPDVLADPEYGRQDLQRVAGFRTTMGAPMILDDEVVGVLGVWRNDVSPFDDREMAIVSAFAAPGGDGGQRRQARAGARGPGCRAGAQGRRARGAARGRRGGQLQPRRRQRARHHRQARRRAVGDRRRLDHGVRRAGPLLPGAQRLPHRPEVVERLRSIRIDLDQTLVGRAARSVGRSWCRTWAPCRSTRTCRSCTTTAGARWSPCRCCARTGSSGR